MKDIDWNKKFFGDSYNPEDEENSGYNEVREMESMGQEREALGYEKGKEDGYVEGYRGGYYEGYLEGASDAEKESKEEYEKRSKKEAWISAGLTGLLAFGSVYLGVWMHKKWGKD